MSQSGTSQSGSFSGADAKGAGSGGGTEQGEKAPKDELIAGARHLGSEVKDMAADIETKIKQKLGIGQPKIVEAADDELAARRPA